MGRKIKVLDRDNFVDAINDYCSHKITMDEAAKKMGCWQENDAYVPSP